MPDPTIDCLICAARQAKRLCTCPSITYWESVNREDGTMEEVQRWGIQHEPGCVLLDE